MKYENVKFVVDMVETNPTGIDLRIVLKNLLNNAIEIDDIYQATLPLLNEKFIINGVTIGYEIYNKYLDLVRCGQIINAIKLIRQNHGLGLKESKDITDELKLRVSFCPKN